MNAYAYGECIVCGMPNEPDGYCEDGCVLWVGMSATPDYRTELLHPLG